MLVVGNWNPAFAPPPKSRVPSRGALQSPAAALRPSSPRKSPAGSVRAAPRSALLLGLNEHSPGRSSSSRRRASRRGGGPIRQTHTERGAGRELRPSRRGAPGGVASSATRLPNPLPLAPPSRGLGRWHLSDGAAGLVATWAGRKGRQLDTPPPLPRGQLRGTGRLLLDSEALVGGLQAQGEGWRVPGSKKGRKFHF